MLNSSQLCDFSTTPFQKSEKLHKQSGSASFDHGPVTLLPQSGAPLGQRNFTGGHMRKYGLIKLGLTAVMLTSASAASEAADVLAGPAYPPPQPPIPFVYNWTGFYAGAHAGVGWSDDDSGGNAGFVGGGQVGFNYQINQWVLGVEGDLAGTTIKDSVSTAVVGPGAVLTGNAEASLDWVSTFAPRVGYAFNNWLVYGKVGGAWAHASGTASAAINGVQVETISVGETVSGWMLGIGAEYALSGNWTAKIEYNMMDFGNSGPFADNTFNVLKAGINYRFGAPGWPF
jgi:outer membrane immunogenic protein